MLVVPVDPRPRSCVRRPYPSSRATPFTGRGNNRGGDAASPHEVGSRIRRTCETGAFTVDGGAGTASIHTVCETNRF